MKYFKILNWTLLLSSLGFVFNYIVAFLNAKQYVYETYGSTSDYYISNHQGALAIGILFSVYVVICAICGILAKQAQKKSFILSYLLALTLTGITLMDNRPYIMMIFPIVAEICVAFLILLLMIKVRK